MTFPCSSSLHLSGCFIPHQNELLKLLGVVSSRSSAVLLSNRANLQTSRFLKTHISSVQHNSEAYPLKPTPTSPPPPTTPSTRGRGGGGLCLCVCVAMPYVHLCAIIHMYVTLCVCVGGGGGGGQRMGWSGKEMRRERETG